MIHLFRTQKINGTFWLLILLVVLQTNRFIASRWIENQQYSLIGWSHSYAQLLFASSVIFVTALLMNNVCNRNQLFGSPSNLPAAFTIILSSFLPNLYSTLKWMALLLLVVFIINKLVKSYQKNKPEPNFFDVSFLIGILAILLPQAMALWLAALVSIFIFNIPKWSYFLLSFIGFFMPWLLWFTICIVQDNLQWFVSQYEQTSSSLTQLPAIHFQSFSPAFLLFFLLGVFGIFFWNSRAHRLHQIQRPLLLSMAVFFTCTVWGLVAFLPLQNEALVLLVLPVTILISYSFFYLRNNLANLLYICVIGLAIANQWIHFIN